MGTSSTSRFFAFVLAAGLSVSGHAQLQGVDPGETKAGAPTDSMTAASQQVNERPVLGWHRAQAGFADHDYGVINMLGYFHYKVDPATGENLFPDTWSTDPVIDAALAAGRKVFLTITSFGFTSNSELLGNSSAIEKLIANLRQLVTDRGGHGVCVDFEEIHPADRDAFNQFVTQLAQEMKRIGKKVLVVLPIYYPENVIDPVALGDLVDYYVMMGYASYHLHSSHAGPISPWRSGKLWNEYSLHSNISRYLAGQFEPGRFMVALPLYGIIWETESLDFPSRSKRGIEQPPFSTISAHFKGKTPMIEPISQSSYFAYQEQGENRQCWFESQQNLTDKIKNLLEMNIAGFGFWTPGYAEGDKALWQALGNAVQAD